jgi:hypothetical protein
MGNLLAQGSEGIKKAMEEADKLGITLSQKQLKAAENFNDEMLRVKSVMLGVRNMIAGRVLPVITRQLRAFQLWWREGRNAERALRVLKITAFFTALVMARIITASVIKQVTIFTRGIWAMVRGLRAANVAASITALKIAAIFAAVALVILVIEDLIGFAQGKDSVIGRLLGDSKLARDLKAALLDTAKAAKDAWAEIGPALRESWRELKPALGELGTAIKPLIGPAFRTAVQSMVFSFKALAWVIRITADLIKLQIKSWKSFSSVANVVVGALGLIAKGLGGITNAGKTALGVMDRILGRDTSLKNLGEIQKRVQQSYEVQVSPTGQPVLPGLFQPSPALAFAGAPGGGVGGAGMFAAPRQPTQDVTNTTVAPGAVNLTVMASGDPQQIARAVSNRMKREIGKTFTNASRDLKRPPAGQ